MRVTEPATVGVNLTEHVLEALCSKSVQDGIENVPALLLDQATCPVGPGSEPTTVALHPIFSPTATESWLQDSVRIVGGGTVVTVLVVVVTETVAVTEDVVVTEAVVVTEDVEGAFTVSGSHALSAPVSL